MQFIDLLIHLGSQVFNPRFEGLQSVGEGEQDLQVHFVAGHCSIRSATACTAWAESASCSS